MIPAWQMIVIKRVALGQLRPDQVAWIERYNALPPDVMMQFALSPEGATIAQQALDVVITGVDAMFSKVAKIQQAAPVPTTQAVKEVPVQAETLVTPAAFQPSLLINPTTQLPYIKA